MPLLGRGKVSKNDAVEDHVTIEDGLDASDGLDVSDGGTKYVPQASNSGLGGKLGGAASQYAHLFTDVARRSPFEQWSREALIDLIILNNIELRLEELIKDEQLVEVCNQLYAGKPVPEIPQPWTPEERILAERAALNIQRNWIRKKRAQRKEQMMDKINNNRLFMDHGVFIPPDLDSNEKEDCPTPRTGFAELEKDWIAPDLGISREYQKYNHPRKGGPGGREFDIKKTTTGRFCILGGCGEQLDLWDEGKASDLGDYGAGITNFFKFEKWCCWTFFILTIIYLPQLIINTFGAGLDSWASYSDISITTLGNLEGNLNGIEVPYCEQFSSYYELDSQWTKYCYLDGQDVAYLYSYIDIAASFFFWISFMWMKNFAKREGPELDGRNVSVGDYTVKIKKLNQNLSEVEVKRHFKNCLGIVPVHVAFAYDNTYEIAQYQRRGRLYRERTHTVHRYRYISMMKETYKISKVWYLVRELPYLKRKSDILLKEISAIDRNLTITEKRKDNKDKRKKKKKKSKVEENDNRSNANTIQKQTPLCCYVTFNDQHDVLQVFSAYSNSWWSYLRMPTIFRLKGQRINVERAPEPSLVIWENLSYGYFSRMFRRIFTTTLAGFFIIISIVIAFGARYYQEENEREPSTCSSSFYNLSKEDQEVAVSDNDELISCFCDQYSSWQQYRQESTLCKDYVVKETLDYFFTFFASFSVITINYIMQLIIQKLTKFERHHSLDSQQTSKCVRLFILKFINTACIILLLNSEDVQRFLEVSLDTAENFQAEWYATAGVSLILVMILNMLSPLYYIFIYWLDFRKQRRMEDEENRKHIMTQDDLNQLFIGPEFNVDFRYATLMVLLYTNFIYAAVMPILVPIGALGFFISYKVDKLLFLRYYRIPPQYGPELSLTVINWVQYALILHLLVSIWCYAFSGIFQTGEEASFLGTEFKNNTEEYISSHLFQGHVFPLLFAIIVLFLWIFLSYITKGTFHLTRKCLGCITCSENLDKGSFTFNEIDISYRKALDRGLLKGLSNYNILQNPKYKAAFAISDKFAAKHSNIESIRKLQGTDDDDDEFIDDNDDGEVEMGVLQNMSRSRAEGQSKSPQINPRSPRSPKSRSPRSPQQMSSQRPLSSRASLSPRNVQIDFK